MKRSLVGLGLVALLGACATDPGGPQGGPPQDRSEIFISPFGEPFVSQPGEPYPVAAWFAGADGDHDGRLTAEEFSADGRRWFVRLDLDGDTVLTPGEIAAYERQIDIAFLHANAGPMRGSGPGRRGGRGEPDGRMGIGEGAGQEDEVSNIQPHMPKASAASESAERMARAGLLAVPQPVRSADRNMDQRITTQEWAAAAERWFGLLDTDHDGALTLDTLPRTAVQGRR
jgi:hypothetical protein